MKIYARKSLRRQSPKGKISIKQIGLMVIVALLFIGLAWLAWWVVNKPISKNKPAGVNLTDSNKIKEKIVTPQITQAAAGQLPEGFPQNLPLAGKTKITESYSATYPNSTVKQATISFASAKTAKENYDFYKKWAEENNWQIINSLDSLDSKILQALYLRKGKEDINIIMNDKIINISYVLL